MALNQIIDELRQARRVLVLTGAGISADSGLPTYRGVGGLYEQEVTDEGMPIEEALSGHTMRHRPDITWKYIHQIESACRGCGHNAAHVALASMEANFERFTVLTQNVDGFHRSAGSSDLIEIHGNIHELHCTSCAAQQRVKDFSQLPQIPPSCTTCGSLIRPRVVLFDELLPNEAMLRLEATLRRGVDFVMAVGTTAAFPYIAAPVIDAARRGIPTLEINPGESEVSSFVRHRLKARAIEVLPALAAGITG